ncbi:MAG TPA: hypothetical protein VIV11_00880, partial [Kofleriaceae bacterium]
MKKLALVFALACLACTERNPAYCGDGTCIDPERPFCDVDGTIAGTPGTCIAVDCTPSEFAHCRGDIAVTCSANGTNYDSVQCPMGCAPAAAGCIECTGNAQCGEMAVCDATANHCRGCRADDECDSLVCDVETGSCIAETAIVYASPSGTGGCSRAQPCSLQQAYVTAANASPIPIVRMLPGNYTSSLRADVPTASAVQIVATGANVVLIGLIAVVEVEGGARVAIRNLTATSERQVQCGLASMTAPLSTIHIRDSVLTMVGTATAFETQRCELGLRSTELSIGAGTVLGTRSDSTFKADGLFVRGSAVNALVFAGSRNVIDIVNSVFVETELVAFLSDTSVPGSSLRFAHSTLLFPHEVGICSGATANYAHSRFENTIIGVVGADDAFTTPNPANCTFVSTILTKQATPLAGTTVSD